MIRKFAVAAGLLFVLGSSPLIAADVPSPRNFTVVMENAKVRVLRAHIDANARTEPHELRDAVAVPLNDYDVKFTKADGTTATGHRTAGQPVWVAGSNRVIEVGDKPADAIVIELK